MLCRHTDWATEWIACNKFLSWYALCTIILLVLAVFHVMPDFYYMMFGFWLCMCVLVSDEMKRPKHDIKRRKKHWTRPIYHSFSFIPFKVFLSRCVVFFPSFVLFSLLILILKFASEHYSYNETLNTNIISMFWLSCTTFLILNSFIRRVVFFFSFSYSLLVCLLVKQMGHSKWNHFYLFELGAVLI